MASTKQFRIRRAMVQTLYSYTGGQALDSILCAPELMLENPSPEMALHEWRELIDSGILIPVPGYDGIVCKLDPVIRREIEGRKGMLPAHPVLFGTAGGSCL